jgi:hypothetical protein
MNINVIITANRVYATYGKKLSYIKGLNPQDYSDKWSAITSAQSTAFLTGTCFEKSTFKIIEINENLTDSDVINYLETNNQ